VSGSDSKTVSSSSVQAIRELFTTKQGTEFFILTSSVDLTEDQKEGEFDEQSMIDKKLLIEIVIVHRSLFLLFKGVLNPNCRPFSFKLKKKRFF